MHRNSTALLWEDIFWTPHWVLLLLHGSMQWISSLSGLPNRRTEDLPQSKLNPASWGLQDYLDCCPLVANGVITVARGDMKLKITKIYTFKDFMYDIWYKQALPPSQQNQPCWMGSSNWWPQFWPLQSWGGWAWRIQDWPAPPHSSVTKCCLRGMNLSPWEKNEKINVTSVLVYNFTDHAQLGVDKISLSHT